MKPLRARLAEHALVLVAFAALSLLATWPLAAHLTDGVLGPPGDNYEYLYKIWWFKTALLEQGRSPLLNPDVFYPVGYDVSLSETTLANMLPAVPLAAIWGEVTAYNLTVLLTFVLSGWAMYWLVRHLTASTVGGMTAGLLFAFAPYRMAHLGAGHLPLLGTQWIPLAFLFAERALQSRRIRDGALAGLFFALAALSSWYYAYLVGLFLATFVLLRGARIRSRLSWRQALPSLLAFLAVAGLLMAPAAVPLLRNAGGGATRYESLAYIDQWSASLADFFWPSVFQPLWGRALADAYMPNVHEGMLYLGWIGIALALLGIWKWRAPASRAYAWLGAIAFVLALGTTLHVAGGPLRVPVPSGVEAAFTRGMNFLTGKMALNRLSFAPMQEAGTIVVPMPTLLLYLFLPFFTAMRVPARFGLGAILAAAVLAGGGAAFVERWARERARRWSIVAGVALLLLLDLASAPFPVGYSEARGQPVDAWLATQPKPSPVAQLPLERTWYGYPLYQQRIHGQPIAYGYGTFVPPQFRAVEDILAGFPDAASLRWLEDAGVRIVLLAQDSFGARWPDVKDVVDAQGSWELVGTFEDRPLFHDGGLMARVPPTPIVPPSEWVAGDKKPYIQDTIWVYRFVDREER